MCLKPRPDGSCNNEMSDMSNTKNLFIPIMSGVVLVLGVAYGLTARDHRDAEFQALSDKVATLEENEGYAESKAEAYRSEAEANAQQIAALKDQLAALQAELDAKPEVAEAAPEEEPQSDTVEVASTGSLGDAAKGEEVFKKCQACHQLGQGAEDRVGPHLNGIFGRRAGAHADFNYSNDMVMMGKDGLTWTLATLDAYLENPKALVSRTRMNFAGLKKPQDRADILAYLRVYSDDPQNIPEAAPTAMATREVELSEDILAIEGDPDYGEYLSSECTTCHQADGSVDGIPSITSWPEEDFVIAMHAYKVKLRPHPVMQMMAGRLSDEEIAALAAYFGSLN